MKLEDIGINPCLFSQAERVQYVQIGNGCEIYIPVKSQQEGLDAKYKLHQLFGSKPVNE
jgi:hypothetical protein